MAGTVLKDGTNKTAYSGSTVTTIAVTLTTAAINRLAVLYIYCGNTTVVSVISAGLTWTLRDRTNTGYEIWTAPVAAVKTALTTTVTVAVAQAILNVIMDSFYITGNTYIPTVDAVVATTFNNTLTPVGNVVTQSPTTTIVSYIVAVGNATITPTAGGGFTLSNSQTWSAGGSMQASEFATFDTPNTGSPVSAGFTLNNVCSGFMTTLSLSGTPGPLVTNVPQPTSITATYNAGVNGNPGSITVGWTPPSGQTTNPTGYLVYRVSNASLAGGNGVPKRVSALAPYAEVAFGTNAFVDKNMGYPAIESGGNIYTYYVTAVYDNITVAPPYLEGLLSSPSATATFLG